MIRLAWRQFRAEAAVALVALVVVAIVLGATGPHLVDVFRTAQRQVSSTYHALQSAVVVLLAVAPALLGIFFGAPLVARELESGTFRLAWTQSVSRSRWLVVKFVFVGVAASALAGGLSLMVAWWANPIDVVNANRFSPGNFGLLGIVPFAYALFAFALGATTGLLFRRTLPAMATTLAGYVAARLAVTNWVRPHFQAPLQRVVPLLEMGAVALSPTPSGGLRMVRIPPYMPNAWPISASIVDKAGRSPSSQYLAKTCPTVFGGPGKAISAGGPLAHVVPGNGLRSCLDKMSPSFHEVVTYQPASRYWPFQLYESALFVILAVALAALCVWWVRRRLV